MVERLNEGLDRKLTLISAPAGFGKTTLVSEWIANCERPAAWLSLDAGDNDLNHFLAYLVAALQTVAANLGAGVLKVLESPPPVPTEPVLTALLNEITAVPDPFVLVLDDYHVIDADPVDSALTFLLERLPPHVHLVIATREDPNLPLARYRVRGQLTELRAADLRFTPAEAAAFLNQVMGLDLSAEDITTLETRTEGWIAGLHLVALALQGTDSMQGHRDAASFIESFTGSHRFVLDYLVEEVLQQQSQSVQAFLLRTSIPDRLCGPLCDAVLHESDASGQERLEYLERANLLVVPLDDRRQWYRYHHLFADVLQARVHKEQPELVPVLHLRASAWYEQNDLPADAIRHALAAEDFERAAGLIELEWSVVRRSCFRSPTWLGWVKALPQELVQARPVLSVGYALELLNSGELAAAEIQLRDAERWLEPTADTNEPPQDPAAEMVVVNKEEFSSIRALLATVRGFHAQALGDVAGTLGHARRALSPASEADYYTRGMASSLLGLATWTNGDLETASRSIADAAASLQRAGNALFAIVIAFVLADIRIAQGCLHEAVDAYKQALQLATAQGESILQGTADLYLGLSELHHEQGDRESSRQHLRRSEELGEQVAAPYWPFRLALTKARIEQSRGDLDGALDLLDEAERLPYSLSSPDVRPIAALKTRVWIGQGRLTEALAWAREQRLSVDDELSYLREFEHVTLARILIAHYRNDGVESSMREAAGLLGRLLTAAEMGERLGSVIEILMLQALAHEAQGDIPTALELLERALTLAEPEGYVRLFADEGAPMVHLLSEAVACRIVPAYVNRLLAAMATGKQEGED